jgi:T5SS/PEP-CTERM-associated repeat protein
MNATMHFRGALLAVAASGSLGLFAVLISITAVGSAARADDKLWNNTHGGSFNTAGNWTGGVPGLSDVAHFGITTNQIFPFSYNVGFDVNPQNARLLVEDDFVNFNLNAHTYTLNAGSANEVGNVSGRAGRLTLSGGNLSIGFQGTMTIGSVAGGSGGLVVTTGGRLTGATPGFFPNVTVGSSGNGSLTLADTGKVEAQDITIGASGTGTGTLMVSDSGKVDALTLDVANAPGSTGTATITGASAVADTSFIYVGFQGSGTLNVDAGALLNNTCASCAGVSSVIGQLQVGVGTVNIDGAGSRWINTLGIEVGDRGHGTVNITAGGRIESAGGVMGVQTTGNGTVNVDGTNSKWLNTGSLTVGGGASGTLSITGGGSVSNADATIGSSAGSTGTATVTGAGSQWDSAGFFVGSSGHGTVNVTAGGTLNTANAVIGSEMGSVGEVTVDGAGSAWTSSSFIFVSGFGPGTGTLTVANGGTVSTQSGLSVRFLGTLRGDGQIIGNVSNIGVVAPGTSPGALHVTGNFTQGTQGKLEIELAGTMAGQFDQLLSSGTASLAGTLAVSLTSGFTPSVGDSFVMLSADGGRSGTFTNNLLPVLPGGLFFNDPQYGAKTVTLSVGGALGDYNHNGIVDAADYTVWRDSLGQSGTGLAADGNASGTIDAGDYNVWKSNFGNRAGSGSGATAAVPEPTSMVLLLAGAMTLLVRRRTAVS